MDTADSANPEIGDSTTDDFLPFQGYELSIIKLYRVPMDNCKANYFPPKCNTRTSQVSRSSVVNPANYLKNTKNFRQTQDKGEKREIDRNKSFSRRPIRNQILTSKKPGNQEQSASVDKKQFEKNIALESKTKWIATRQTTKQIQQKQEDRSRNTRTTGIRSKNRRRAFSQLQTFQQLPEIARNREMRARIYEAAQISKPIKRKTELADKSRGRSKEKAEPSSSKTGKTQIHSFRKEKDMVCMTTADLNKFGFKQESSSQEGTIEKLKLRISQERKTISRMEKDHRILEELNEAIGKQ